MNISELLSSIKMDLGIYALRLPFKDPDSALMDVIKLKTLKTFSIYQPHVISLTFDLSDELTKLKEEYMESIYVLPDMGREYIYVRKIMPKSKLLSSGYISPIFDGSPQTMDFLALTQANANLASVAAPPITFKFEPPNKLHVFNLATMYGMIDIEVGVKHADNLSTIAETSWESFLELATLDIKRFLYNNLKHYKELNTAFGTISLQIDDWSNAEGERRDLVEKWKDLYHLDTEQFIII